MLGVKWPEQDLREAQSAINRAIRVGKRDVETALVQAGVYLARSASAATKTAPKKRKNKKNLGSDDQFPPSVYPYYREVWRRGPDDQFRYYIKTKDDEKFSRIPHAGLAKKSWYWMIPEIRRRGGNNFAQEVEKRSRGMDYEIEMSNKLRYIEKALKTDDGGNMLLRQALGKATRQLERDTDRRLARMTR